MCQCHEIIWFKILVNGPLLSTTVSQREHQPQRRWDRERAHCQSEEPKHREESLRKQRDRNKARFASNTAEQRHTIHQQRYTWQEQEMEHQWEARLEGVCACQREQVTIKVSKEREIILQAMHTQQRETLDHCNYRRERLMAIAMEGAWTPNWGYNRSCHYYNSCWYTKPRWRHSTSLLPN